VANPSATSDPYRTLFIGRLAYETTEKKLQREFEEFGPVTGVTIVRTKSGALRPLRLSRLG
jgi:U1 small nuclear ribonucleoprotein